MDRMQLPSGTFPAHLADEVTNKNDKCRGLNQQIRAASAGFLSLKANHFMKKENGNV